MPAQSERRLVTCLFIDAVLGPTLERLDRFAEGGSRLAGATAAAIREEIAAADGGPAPSHDELRNHGYLGISELLCFRPVRAG